MVPELPSPPSGTSFASAQSVVSVQRRRRKLPVDANINSKGNDNTNNNNNNKSRNNNSSNPNPNNSNNNSNRKINIHTKNPGRNEFSSVVSGRRTVSLLESSKRKWFRGDWKKVFVEMLIAITVLYFWVSILWFEYSALKNHDNDSSGNGSNIYVPVLRTKNASDGNSHGYDSIFCRVDSFQTNTRKTNNPPPPRNQTKPVFLWGIPSTTSDFETGRRKLLRKTYLGFYERLHSDKKYNTSNNSNSGSQNTICSFHDWTCNSTVRADCQMIYVFFVGGHDASNATATAEGEAHHIPSSKLKNNLLPPPILLNESITDFRDMLLPLDDKRLKSKELKVDEPGTVYLDIRENQFDGKMTTWFKFASLVAQEYNSHDAKSKSKSNTNLSTNDPKIEYIFKVDSDLILFTPHFLHWFEGIHGEQLQQQDHAQTPTQQSTTTPNITAPRHRLVRRIYGGIEFPATNCVENFTFDHPCPLPLSGPSYMSGELNFVSVDLATYIASDDCPRDRWTIPHEDVSLSNYVYSYNHNKAYRKREGEKDPPPLGNNRNNNNSEDEDHSIHIVGVNTSQVLLLPNMKANWESVSILKNPDILRTGELLWGHSIKRGEYKQYLVWKKDSKFQSFWKIFYKAYTTPLHTNVFASKRIVTRPLNSTFKKQRQPKQPQPPTDNHQNAEIFKK